MSEQPDERIHLIRQWIEKADEDFRTAEYTITMPDHCPYATICFHCQQCVEKYIKALLIWHSVDFPKIHDIGELLDLLPCDIDLPLTGEEQERLTDYAVVSRYPVELEPISGPDAEDALSMAKRIREVVRKRLPDGALEEESDRME